MTDPPPAGRLTGVFRHLDKLTENRWLKALVAIGEVVGLFVLLGSGVSWLVRQVGDDDHSAAATGAAPSVVVPSGDGSTRIPSVPSSSAPRSTDPAVEQLCFSSTSTPVDCRENHRTEMLPTFGACDQRMVIEYVGGNASLDVTIAKALKKPGGKCLLAADRDVTGSARDVLQGRDSANWRRCYDRRTGTNVSCGVLHSGEYLATGSLRPATDAECQVAAATYLDQNPGNLLEDLEVRPLPVKSGNPDTARCIIAARGNHLLTTSIRDLGSRPVPIYSQ